MVVRILQCLFFRLVDKMKFFFYMSGLVLGECLCSSEFVLEDNCGGDLLECGSAEYGSIDAGFGKNEEDHGVCCASLWSEDEDSVSEF